MAETRVAPAVAEEEIVEEEVPPPPPPRIWPWLLVLLLLVLAGLAAYWFLAREDEKTTMPNVVGLAEAEARARIAEAELEADVDRRPSRRPRGVVFAQVPGAGKQLNEGERVELLVSSALVRVVVPSVRDLPEAEARAKLEDAGFKVRSRRVFAGAARGRVVEQDPRGGERVERGSTVELIVSKGRNLNRVPDVVGMTEDEAVRALRAREFEPRIFDVPSEEPRGTVVAQVPRAGVLGPPDARVRINVSSGDPASAEQERPGETTGGGGGEDAAVTVPNVVGLAQTPALRVLFDRRLNGVVRFQRSEEPLGRVVAQQPAGGTSAQAGRRVVLTVSAGPNPELVAVPDVTGQTEDEARATLEAEGFRSAVVRDTRSDAPAGTVVSQQPAAGTQAPRGAIITLFVSSGG